MSGDQARLAVHAARRTADGALTIVVVNKTAEALTSPLSLSGFTATGSAHVFRWSGQEKIDQLPDQALSGSAFTATYPAQSVTVFQLGGSVGNPPPLALSVAGFSASQKGRLFTAALQVRRDDTGALLGSGQVTCNAKVSGKPRSSSSSGFSESSARCSWSVPKRLRGKRIAGSIAVTYSGATAARSFSAKIK